MRLWLLLSFCFSLSPVPAPAQTVSTVPESRDEMVARKNAWTVGLISGQLEGLYPRFAAEMKKVLDDRDELRVMPILAYGAESNVEDLLYTRGVDVAFTQSDALHYFRTVRNIPNIAERVHYITALYSTEVHILARREIKDIRDLQGKAVSFGPVGNSAALTGPIVLDRLKIKVNQKNFDHTTGLEKLKSGEVDAVVRVMGKPGDVFASVAKESGLHFLPLSYDEASKKIFDNIYSLGELTHADYPNLIPENRIIDTISVTTVLAVYNWPRNTDRFRRVERFTQYLFNRFEGFMAPGFHPKWKEVNLAAPVPGWTRFSIAQDMLQARNSPPPNAELGRDVTNYLKSQGSPHNPAEVEALVNDFLSWRGQRKP